ncbi:MAG TPA: AAA family ATPase [Patescibacteria group bacterium]|nr:AAA family ATPase [Patescibacteria group bacterium]
MPLLTKIALKNFGLFREKRVINLADGTYFVGVNNSGKSTVLNAVKVFFDDSTIGAENLINKTSLLSKKKGSNLAEITIDFDLDTLTTKKFKQDLIKTYGQILNITKIISVATDTKAVSFFYKIEGHRQMPSEDLPEDIAKLLKSIKVAYLHPQEGNTLLKQAQEKLRQRLLANWGRGANITQSIKQLQSEWDVLRGQSKNYLSGALTDSMQKMWPGCEISINLPKDIRELIAVSEINFTGYKNAPEIALPYQGTGAQSTVLYLAHFLLDSDRSLHRGEYHPLWLLEEPESFLHINLLSSLARQLNSKRWLDNIQMLVSTHSPVLLAASRSAENKVAWNIFGGGDIRYNKVTIDFSDDEIKEIGSLMGDPNFFAYFLAARNERLIFVEDCKALTVEGYRDSGVAVTQGLKGVSEIARFIDVFLSAPCILDKNIYFIIDCDKGKKEFTRFYDPTKIDYSQDGFRRYKVKGSENIFLIFLPEGTATEQLFAEYDNHLDECISKIWDSGWKLLPSVPTSLSGTMNAVRRQSVQSRDEAVALIKNQEDVKYLFWEKVRNFHYRITSKAINALGILLSD